jgi:hypothetical protein
MRLCSGFLGSPPFSVRRLQVAKRARALGAGVHVGQARDVVFVEVAPCPCGQLLAYAVHLVCYDLFELQPVLLRRFLGGQVSELGH